MAFRDSVPVHLWGCETVTIYAGSLKIPFLIHKDLLCSKSPYFKLMFSSRMIEANTGTATESEVNCRAFQLFISWLYTGQVSKNIQAVTGDDKVRDEVRILFYSVVDKFMLPDEVKQEILQHILADAVIDCVPARCIQPRAVHLVFELLAKDDPLRKVVLDIACRDLMQHNFIEWFRQVLAGLGEGGTKSFLMAFNENVRLGGAVLEKTPDWNQSMPGSQLKTWMKAAATDVKSVRRYKTGFLQDIVRGRGGFRGVQGRSTERGNYIQAGDLSSVAGTAYRDAVLHQVD